MKNVLADDTAWSHTPFPLGHLTRCRIHCTTAELLEHLQSNASDYHKGSKAVMLNCEIISHNAYINVTYEYTNK